MVLATGGAVYTCVGPVESGILWVLALDEPPAASLDDIGLGVTTVTCPPGSVEVYGVPPEGDDIKEGVIIVTCPPESVDVNGAPSDGEDIGVGVTTIICPFGSVDVYGISPDGEIVRDPNLYTMA